MPTIFRTPTLAVIPPAVCPAALPIAGTSPERKGIICGVMANDRQRETGVRADGIFKPLQLAVARDGSDGVFLSAEGDPRTIERFCGGDAVPVLHDGPVPGGRDSYTYCPVWQAEVDRLATERDRLTAQEAPESYSHGVPEDEVSDEIAWDRARRGLDDLAPRKGA